MTRRRKGNQKADIRQRGAFADLLGISKNTIYMHIRNYRKACGPEDSSRR